MKKVLLISVLVTVLSCQKDGVSLYSDNNYPTVYKAKAATEIKQAKTDYFKTNKYIQSSLDEFGFCDFQTEDRSVAYPPKTDSLTQSQAEERAMNFLSINKTFTGISNINNLQFVTTKNSTGLGGTQFWHLKSTTQKIDTVEVLFTSILVHICNGEVYLCYGNWYPHVYIPQKFTFNQQKAKERLVNKVVSHYTIAGEKYDFKISASDIEKSSARLVIYPVTKEDRIELRVTWEVKIPGPVFYKIYTDVMTGDIVNEEPTIIS